MLNRLIIDYTQPSCNISDLVIIQPSCSISNLVVAFTTMLRTRILSNRCAYHIAGNHDESNHRSNVKGSTIVHFSDLQWQKPPVERT